MENSSQEIYWILSFGTLGMLTLAFAIVLFVYLYQRKLIKKHQEFRQIEDMLKKQELKSTYALLEGQDKERKRISKELHDNLGSILVSAGMYLDSIPDSQLETREKAKLVKLGELLSKASSETRKISHSLDSGLLRHFGLKSTLEDLATTLSENSRIQPRFEVNVNSGLTNEMAMEIYRMIQEMVNNTLKHAAATKISLEVTEIKNEYINIIYQDNGQGFDMEETALQKGIGLKNIESRVHKLDGKLKIESEVGKGVTINIEIPING